MGSLQSPKLPDSVGITKFIIFGSRLVWNFIDIFIYGYRLGKTGRW